MNDFIDLYDDIYEKIFKLLDLSSIGALMLVNKKFYWLIENFIDRKQLKVIQASYKIISIPYDFTLFAEYYALCKLLSEATNKEEVIMYLNKGINLSDHLVKRLKLTMNPELYEIIKFHIKLFDMEEGELETNDKMAINIRRGCNTLLIDNINSIKLVNISLLFSNKADLSLKSVYDKDAYQLIANSPLIIDECWNELYQYTEIKDETDKIEELIKSLAKGTVKINQLLETKTLMKFDPNNMPITAIAYLSLRSKLKPYLHYLNIPELDSNYSTSLHKLDFTKQETDIQIYLFSHLVNMKDLDGKTPLHKAAKGCNEAIKALIKVGADINAETIKGRTVLHYVVKYHNNEIIKTLIAADIDLEINDDNGNTALQIAINDDNNEAVTILTSTKKGKPTDIEVDTSIRVL